MSRDYSEEIAAIETRIKNRCHKMEEASETLVEAVIVFLKSWYWEQTESHVVREPDRTSALGIEKLSELKAAVGRVQDEADGEVRKIFSQPDLWWHVEQAEQRYEWYGNRAPEPLDEAIRLAAGRIAPILEQYGYLNKDPKTGSSWREWDSSGHHHPPDARFRYPYSFDWPDELKQILSQYSEHHSQATIDMRKLEEVKMAMAQAGAKDQWDQA